MHPSRTCDKAEMWQINLLRFASKYLCCNRSVVSSWGVPLVITVAAVSLNKIGYDASEVSVGWCWVSIQAPDRYLWMLLTGKIWEFLAYITLPVLYILIKRHIHIAVRMKLGFYLLAVIYGILKLITSCSHDGEKSWAILFHYYV